MKGMNRHTAIGVVTRDAELRMVNVNGVQTPRCTFTIVVNETRPNGKTLETYFDVVAWYDYAKRIAPWVLKGRQVYVSGPVRLNMYKDSTGETRAHMQISNPEVVLLGKKPKTDTANDVEELTEADYIAPEDPEAELPF